MLAFLGEMFFASWSPQGLLCCFFKRMFLGMLDPSMALVVISGKDCNCHCSRGASEKKAIMYYNKFTLSRVEGRPSLKLCGEHMWSGDMSKFCKIKKKRKKFAN